MRFDVFFREGNICHPPEGENPIVCSHFKKSIMENIAPSNDIKTIDANEDVLLGDDLSRFPAYPKMHFGAFFAEVTSSSLVTRTETTIVGKRSPVFNQLGVLFKGVDIKESSDRTYQELMIKPHGGGPQKSIKCEESSFRASIGQRVAFVTCQAQDYSLDLGMVNLETGQKTWFVAALSEAQKQVDSKNNFWYGLCIIAGVIAGFMFGSIWIGVTAFFGILIALYMLTPVLKEAENQENALKATVERIPKCLDSLYKKYGAS